MSSSVDSLLSFFSGLEIPILNPEISSLPVIISVLITGVVIFLLMAIFAVLAVYFER